MSEEQNKFDEILRDKFSSQKFPFDEENWEEAEKQIDRKRKREKQRKAAVIFFLGLFVGVGAMIPFVNHETQNQGGIASDAGAMNKNKTEEVGINNDADKIKDLSGEKNNSISKHTTPPVQTFQKDKSSGNEKHVLAAANSPVISKIKMKKNKTGKAKLSFESEINTTGNGFISPNIKTHNEQNSAADTNADANNLTKEKKSDETENALTLLLNNLKPGNDSSTAVVQVNIPLIEPQPPGTLDAFAFYIDAGANYVFGWNNNPGMEGNGINPVLGIGVTHFFNHHWAMSSGIEYTGIAHLTQSEKTYTTYIDDFGENKIDSIIAARWIHYVLVPVFLQYHFDNKNSIEIGGSAAHLVTTTSDFIVKTYTDLKDPVQTTKKSSGYTEGFNQWDASIAIAYRRKLNDNFNISAEMHYGLSDIRDNSFFAKQLSERSTGIKILISYRLF